MPGDVVNWTPWLACEATLRFHEALNEASRVGGSEEESTTGLQDAQRFTKFGDWIGDVFNDVMEGHGGKAGVGKMGRFEAAVKDFKFENTSDVKVSVMVGFDTDDGKTARMCVLEEESTVTAYIEQRAVLATMECQKVEEVVVLRLLPGRRRARVKG
jgi:hypothetical protein